MNRTSKSYVTIGADGSFVPEPAAGTSEDAEKSAQKGVSSEFAGNGEGASDAADAAADVAYPLARIAEEAHADKGGSAQDLPVALVLARGREGKRLMGVVRDAGLVPCAVYTHDRRFEPQVRAADATVCIGERFRPELFSNEAAMLKAIDEAQASVVLLRDEALPLSEDEHFLAHAAARGVRVLAPISSDAPALGWVLLEGDASAAGGESWRLCRSCGLEFAVDRFAAGGYRCPACGAYVRMTSDERIATVLDAGTFEEWDRVLPEKDPLEFPGYADKLASLRKRTGFEEGVRTGTGAIAGLRVALAVMDSSFMMASMGSVVGEKLARMFERATDEGLPVVVFCASGGARMQEGIISLMQMAKVSAAVARHGAAGLFYLSVLTDPTTGGVTASFAMQGDVIIAEPHALIGFAGQRVIRDTIRQELPEGFQTAEFALEHGLIDAIVPRDRMREAIAHLVALHVPRGFGHEPAPGSRDVIVDFASVEESLERQAPAYSGVSYDVQPVVEEEVDDEPDRPTAAGVAQSLRRALFSLRGQHAAFDEDEGEDGGAPEGSAASRPLSSDAGDTVEGDEPATAWDHVLAARNAHRPTGTVYVNELVEGFIELHGDRAFADDAAIVAGIGWIGYQPVTIIAQEKGKNVKERVRRNFGCAQPEGYRKALRLMRQAEKFGRPVICIVDTQGALCGIGAEERGQGGAIADNLMSMAQLRVPILSVLVGEGGSGGALALAVADCVAMQRNATYSVLSPEGFASILWKDGKRAPEAAAVMKMTAADCKHLGVVDAVLDEGRGAHLDPDVAAQNVRDFVTGMLPTLLATDPDELIAARYNRFRAF